MCQVILVNGMPRSGSTWLYNATRLILSGITAPDDFICGWYADVKVTKKVTLLKVHGINHSLLNRATTILYSYRDVRDVLASRRRMWKMEPSLNVARSLISESIFFDKVAHYIMRYEDFIEDQIDVINNLIKLFDADGLDAYEIHDELQTKKKPADDNRSYDKEELYHPGHITSGKHMDFDRYVPAWMIENIESSFSSWFINHGYVLSSK